MSLIAATGLGKSFGSVDLFSRISLSIPKHSRIAIVGPNGIGKTTLLRILAGEESASRGVVSQARGLMIGFLPQEAGLDAVHTLWEECLTPFADLRAQEAELARLEEMMSSPDHTEQIIQRYGAMQAEFEHRGGYTYQNRLEQVLSGLGFSTEEFHYPLPHLSGGQRTRALLARLLLSEPDLLILDEPTNHLDIQAVEWLENYLNQWDGATLIVSHDRYFLDKVVNVIWEMTRAGFEVYHGNYSAYLNQREQRWERRRLVFEGEQEKLLRDVDFIKRNISGQNVTQARGRLRRLSRYLQAVEQIGLEDAMSRSWGDISAEVDTTTSMMSPEEAERRVRAMHTPSNRPPHLHLKLKPDQRSGEIILRTQALVIGYPGNPLFCAPDIELRRLECAALIGPNGAGKTTFLKTILAKLPPLQGEVSLGASIDIGYFAQAHEGLNPENTLVQEIEPLAPKMLLADIRNYLARFLFTGEDVFKPVSVLSGGERGRLALAKLALTGSNLLLLDEPTNHLDIPSQEILQDVLAQFGGTILLVSHDRYLIDALATQIWEIDETKEALRVFKGTYSQYHAQLEVEREAEKAAQEGRWASSKGQAHKSRGTSDERRRRARLQEVETLIANLEEELRIISHKLENPPADPARVNKLGNDYVRIQKELDSLIEEWADFHEAG
jgi:ATP-binding cassette subfamily F protein 3